MFQPAGRLIIEKDGKVWSRRRRREILDASDPQAVATLAAAQAMGAETGKDVAKQVPALVEQGRNAATQAIGNIDYGMSQLAKASQGGINTEYFSGRFDRGAIGAQIAWISDGQDSVHQC